MGKDRDTGNLAVMGHVYKGAYQELDPLIRCHHLMIWWENLLLLLWCSGRIHLSHVEICGTDLWCAIKMATA